MCPDDRSGEMRRAPWEHPDWYDLHDTTWTAGPEREPEHHRELVRALPTLDAGDHLVDVGAGTGKVAAQIARAYPRLGRVTLIEPNPDNLERAPRRAATGARVDVLASGLGDGSRLPRGSATLLTIGSVLMPTMELRGVTLADGLEWLRTALDEVRSMLSPGGLFFAAETLAPPWARGGVTDPVRRLAMAELTAELERVGLAEVECAYRFRDRVVRRARWAP